MNNKSSLALLIMVGLVTVIILSIFTYNLYDYIFTTIHCSAPTPPIPPTPANTPVPVPGALNSRATLELLENLYNILQVAAYPQGGYDIIHLSIFFEMVAEETFCFLFGHLDGVDNVLAISVNHVIHTVDPGLVYWFIFFSLLILIYHQ
jgi:hypothetical protein